MARRQHCDGATKLSQKIVALAAIASRGAVMADSVTGGLCYDPRGLAEMRDLSRDPYLETPTCVSYSLSTNNDYCYQLQYRIDGRVNAVGPVPVAAEADVLGYTCLLFEDVDCVTNRTGGGYIAVNGGASWSNFSAVYWGMRCGATDSG